MNILINFPPLSLLFLKLSLWGVGANTARFLSLSFLRDAMRVMHVPPHLKFYGAYKDFFKGEEMKIQEIFLQGKEAGKSFSYFFLSYPSQARRSLRN